MADAMITAAAAPWFVIIDDQGEERSVTSVLPETLPKSWAVVEIDGPPDYGLVAWDAGTRSYVGHGRIQKSAVDELVAKVLADPALQSLDAATRDSVELALRRQEVA